MKSLADTLGGNAPARPCGRQYRHTATFVMDARKHFTALTTQQRARLLDELERMERRTKPANHSNGLVTRPGLIVLRALVLYFQDRKSGACFPSYSAIQDRTGLCRQSIAKAIKRLERIGVLKVVRRLVRRTIDGVVRCVQASNLYAFASLPARVDLSSLADPAPKRFPSLLGRLNLTSRVMGRGLERSNTHPLALLINGVRG